MVQTAPEQPSDLALIQRAAGGDAQALEQLMRRHNQRLFRAARGILHNDSEAEEAIQDAWWNAWQHCKEFRADAQPLTWLTRIAINEALMRLRRNKTRAAVIQPTAADADGTRPPEEERVMADESTRPENQLARQQLRQLIETRVNELPDKYRSVFMLRGIEGLTFTEVGALLHLSQPTARVRYLRARRLLRKALRDDIDVSASDAFEFAGARCDRVVAAVRQRLERARTGGS